jgi:hypothetical protein
MEASTTEAAQPAARPGSGRPEAESEETDAHLKRERDVIDEVATQGVKNDPNRARNALEWFLADEEEDESPPHYPLDLNVGTKPGEENVIRWVVRPVMSTRIDELRRAHQTQSGNRQQRRRGAAGPELDVARFNAALVFEATVEPNMAEVLEKKKTKEGVSGADVVLWRFRHKPLLVDQIAGEILRVSGADEDDLREAREVIAAKN